MGPREEETARSDIKGRDERKSERREGGPVAYGRNWISRCAFLGGPLLIFFRLKDDERGGEKKREREGEQEVEKSALAHVRAW